MEEGALILVRLLEVGGVWRLLGDLMLERLLVEGSELRLETLVEVEGEGEEVIWVVNLTSFSRRLWNKEVCHYIEWAWL